MTATPTTRPSSSYKTYYLEGIVTLLSPLSHIGENLGTTTHFSRQAIVGPDGKRVECFAHSGNGFRGHFRDDGVKHLLRALGSPNLPPKPFHLLFGGGTMTGEFVVDIDLARRLREALPLLSLFGAATGNHIMPGKWNTGILWPICAETQRLLPAYLRNPEAPSCRTWITELNFSRKDDGKDERLTRHMLPGATGQLALGGAEPTPKKRGKGKPSDDGEAGDEPAQQMRYTVQALAAGGELFQRIHVLDATELEFGALMSCFSEWSQAPYLGGNNAKGLGLVAGEWTYQTGEMDEPAPLVSAGPGEFAPKNAGKEALDRYDAYLLDAYERYISGNAPEIRQALGVSGGVHGTA